MSAEGDEAVREHLRELLRTLPQLPGVYRMLDLASEVLYVGKARSLKQRVSSYFQKNVSSEKTRALVARIVDIEVTVTGSETEALLLEQTLIKQYNPPYNVLLRDDKSYPYIFISEGEAYPRIAFHRGSRRARGRYFGPYPSANAVRDSLHLLQKLFQVRQCEDAFFRNRDRPCLQYQIRRCRAPCVGLVSEEDYAGDVRHTALFLEGRSEEVNAILMGKMQEAADRLAYEQAAKYRDQLTVLRQIQEQQHVLKEGGDVDVVALVARPGGVCIAVLFVRQGRVLGTRHYFPAAHGETERDELLDEFLPQFYFNAEHWQDMPREIILEQEYADAEVFRAALKQISGRDVELKFRVRENRAAWVELARLNAEQALTARLINRLQVAERFRLLADDLGLSEIPGRLECFDISHSMGEATTASCVVFNQQGPCKSDYRRFNIEGIVPGDDFAAMHQALERRFAGTSSDAKLPDILFIDGGKGQLTQAQQVLSALGLSGVRLVGISKGEGRKPGLETLHFADGSDMQMAHDSPALHLIQQIRDEAHRFAITGHRQRRGKARSTSSLQAIPGIGPQRRRQLLAHFGGLQEVMRATVKELSAVPGISIKLAEDIYSALHGRS